MTVPQLIVAVCEKYNVPFSMAVHADKPSDCHTGPGVYWAEFTDGGTYIGKARNLRNRLSKHHVIDKHTVSRMLTFEFPMGSAWHAYIEEVVLLQMPGSLNQESGTSCSETLKFRKKRKDETRKQYNKAKFRWLKAQQ